MVPVENLLMIPRLRADLSFKTILEKISKALMVLVKNAFNKFSVKVLYTC